MEEQWRERKGKALLRSCFFLCLSQEQIAVTGKPHYRQLEAGRLERLEFSQGKGSSGVGACRKDFAKTTGTVMK